MPHFTEEQLNEIATTCGLKRNEENLPVRDGIGTKHTDVWWRGEGRPERVIAGNSSHWHNIRNHPECYQLRRPNFIIKYED